MASLLSSFEFRFGLLNKQKGLLEQVSHFFKGSFKLLDEATLGVFVRESEELRFQRWETSTMKQVQSEYAMVFANRHKDGLDRLAAMLESRILFPDVCKRAIVSHAKVLLLAACYFPFLCVVCLSYVSPFCLYHCICPTVSASIVYAFCASLTRRYVAQSSGSDFREAQLSEDAFFVDLLPQMFNEWDVMAPRLCDLSIKLAEVETW